MVNLRVLVPAMVAIVIVVVALAIFLTAPQQQRPTQPTPTPPQPQQSITCPIPPSEVPDVIKIGLSAQLSGAYALQGTDGLVGILAIAKWANEVKGGLEICGKRVKVQVVYYDDESRRENTIANYERLVTQDKVDFLLGPYGSLLMIAAAPIAEKYKKLIVSWGALSDLIFKQGYKYSVLAVQPASGNAKVLIDFLTKVDPGAKNVAIIYGEDEYSRLVAGGARDYAEAKGLRIVYYRSYPVDTKDLTPLLAELKGLQIDMLLFIHSPVPLGLLAARQVADLGIYAKSFVYLLAAAEPTSYQQLKEAMECAVGITAWDPRRAYTPQVARSMGIEWYGPTNEEFLRLVNETMATMGIRGRWPPSYRVAIGAQGMLALLAAIEKAQSTKSDDVRLAMNKMDILTFVGRFKIDPATGLQVGHTYWIVQWQGGKLEVVWPQEVATSRPYYPALTIQDRLAGKKCVPTG